MRKAFMLCLAIAFTYASQAQFESSNLYGSVSGNYTMFKRDFKQKTAGVKIDVGYSFTEKIRAAIGYTYHAPIKVAYSTQVTNGIDVQYINSEIVYNFSTISLLANYTFSQSEEQPISFYAPVGIGYIMVKYKEKLKQAVPAGYNTVNQLEPGKESGFVMNFGLGGQYNFGTFRAFVDASLVLPANTVNGQYVENAITTHLVFNAGVRIPIGARDSESD